MIDNFILGFRTAFKILQSYHDMTSCQLSPEYSVVLSVNLKWHFILPEVLCIKESMAHNLFFCDSGKCPIDFLRFRSFVLKVLVRRRSTGSALYVPVISKNEVPILYIPGYLVIGGKWD